MKKAIKANLEFITDEEVIKSGIDSKEYQYALLKSQVLPQNQMPVNNYHFLTIKKRIAMINKKPSNRINLSNYLLLLPAIMLLVLLTGISKADLSGKGVVEAFTNLPATPLLQIFTDETATGQSVVNTGATRSDAMTVNDKEQITLVMAAAMDTIIKDSVKTISGFRIRVNEADNPLNSVIKNMGKSNLSPELLYVIDGERMPKGISLLNPEDIETINVYKGEGANLRYGEDGKNGVIDIRTKKAGSGKPSDSSKPRTVVGYAYNQNQNISLSDIENQVIILDGKEISKSDLDQIKVSNIGTINILKGAAAVSKYGEKGEKGVIVITTK
jgi:TonB-dependent SusC/RagA subfamily outer membrane receptor